jgi:hypothetical protein
MFNDLNTKIQQQLKLSESKIQVRLSELELLLNLENNAIRDEIQSYLKKQEDISKTIEYIDTLQKVEEEADLRIEQLKKEEKEKQRRYNLNRKFRLESWIMDYRQGAARTKGTSIHDSYLQNIHYYQNQLSSLISSLES